MVLELSEKYVTKVFEVLRVSDKITRIKAEVKGVRVNVVCAYVPQVGCEENEKKYFGMS